jgi:hypothetical protein
MNRSPCISVCLFLSLFLSLTLTLTLTRAAYAQEAGGDTVDLEDVELSYIYPLVMGTGVYKIDGRRLSMLTVPVSITSARLDERDPEFGVKWLLPVTIGYDEVEDFDWLEDRIGENLVTLSAMPGVQISIPLNETWIARPFAQAGIGHDFVSNEVFMLGAIGARLLGTWAFDDSWEVRWGASARLAGELQLKSGREYSFGMLETGVDLRRDLPLRVDEQQVNAGVYYRLQTYYPEWTVGQLFRDRSEVHDVHEIGVSVGLRQPRKIFGFTFRRVRLGYQRGSGFKGWSVGTEFPF